MLWEDVNEGHVFRDNSECLRRFETKTYDTYTLLLPKTLRSVYFGSQGKNDNTSMRSFCASADHFLLCDVNRCSTAVKRSIKKLVETSFIPKTYELHISLKGEWEEVLATQTREMALPLKTYVWLNMKEIHTLVKNNEKIRLVSNLKRRKTFIPFDSFYTGKKECFCIATDTGRYEVCGLVNHNSVTLRDIVFHSLTHSDDIKLALIDLKRSEFEYLKGTNGIVGVGNTPREAAEILRLARDILYKRNEENSKRNLTNFADWQPQKPTDKVKIFNTEFSEDTSFDVEIAGEKKTMTAKEILQYMN